ncbi:MAG TPA: universal stress protein [Gemmatimonadaceae bacterium]|nr:universal stress protein [Gemmatimonadaceae bacterium]
MTTATELRTSPDQTSSPRGTGSPRAPLLVAVKPYQRGDAALEMAQWLADEEKRPLHALSVLESNDTVAIAAGVPILPEHYHTEERAAVSDLLEERLGRRALHAGLERRVDVIEGPTARSVADVAEERGASAIVVGTGSHGRLGRLVYGEHAVQISRLTDRPLLVVPPTAHAGRFARAMVAVDFSPASRRAAQLALDFVADEGELALVHVKSAVSLSEESAGWWEEAYERRTADLFHRFAALLQLPRGIRVTTRMLHGDVAATLVAHARERYVGLVACGGRRHSFLERVLLGSVSTELIRRTEWPLLVVPSRAQDEVDDARPAMGGVVESWDASAWPGLIERFGRRNGGRPTQLRFRTASPQGVGSVEQGYRLLDASFDRAATRAEIVLGDADSSGSQVSHRVSNVRAVMVSTDASGRDSALRLDTASGRCTVTLSDDV